MSMHMTASERLAFLKEVRPAILSLTVAERGPLASPVWYDVAANGDLCFLTQSHTRKGKLIAADGHITLTVQRHEVPYAYVSAEGPVIEIRAYDLETDLLAMATRYLGAEGGRQYADNARAGNDPATSIRVTMRPERWRTADYAKRQAGAG